jgi:hypothetical protein
VQGELCGQEGEVSGSEGADAAVCAEGDVIEANALWQEAEVTFADLKVGDFFLWHDSALLDRDTVNINIKIAWSHDGSGFAYDLFTRQDAGDKQEGFNIPGDTRVIKLNGVL